MEVPFHSLLTSVLHGGEYAGSHPGLYRHGEKHPMPTKHEGGWAGQKASLGHLKRKSLAPARNQTIPHLSSLQSGHYTDLPPQILKDKSIIII
jgi:hypothetical protein